MNKEFRKLVRQDTMQTMLTTAGIMAFVFAIVKSNDWTLIPTLFLIVATIITAIVLKCLKDETYFDGEFYRYAHIVSKLCMVNALWIVIVGIYLAWAPK